MISKKIHHKSKGIDNEEYIYLDYDEDSGEFSIRQGYSYKDTYTLTWSGDETCHEIEDFVRNHPKYESKIYNKINKIENELRN